MRPFILTTIANNYNYTPPRRQQHIHMHYLHRVHCAVTAIMYTLYCDCLHSLQFSTNKNYDYKTSPTCVTTTQKLHTLIHDDVCNSSLAYVNSSILTRAAECIK